MATRVVIAGVSTRAAAESAANAGFAVTAIDAYGDLDQHPSVRSLPLKRDFTSHAAARAARDVDCDAAAYLSPFENHPRAVDALSSGRALWGASLEVLRRVRDPFLVAGTLRRLGFATPITRVDVTSEAKEWLVKPFRSGGGQRVRPWLPGARVPRGSYVQERIEGTPASIVFIAAGGRAVPLGLSRQLVGEAAFGTSGYRYCGNILAGTRDAEVDAVADVTHALVQAVAEAFQLVGVNGIDFIIRDGVPYPIEVNPRWCSSMELVERQYGVSMFGAHAAACVDGSLPAFDLPRARLSGAVTGKAIIFSPADVVVGDTRSWLADETVRDVPKPGERISAGQPVCTVFADGGSSEDCLAALKKRAHDIRVEIVTVRSKLTLEQKRATT